MAMIDWFLRWVHEHLRRHPNPRWPDPESEEGKTYFEPLHKEFRRKAVTEEEAKEASIRLVFEKAYRSDHPRRLMEIIAEIRRERAAASPGSDSSTRESALEGSKHCPHCGGEGMAVVRWLNPREGIPEGTCAAYCLCPMGHWLRRQHEHGAKDIHKRTPSLADVLAGRFPQFEAFEAPVLCP